MECFLASASCYKTFGRGLIFKASTLLPGPPLRFIDPKEGLHVTMAELSLRAYFALGIACGLVPKGTCPGELLNTTKTWSLWKLPSVSIGYNSDTCSWYANGVQSLAKPFNTVRHQWYEYSRFASIASSSITSLKLRKSSKPEGTLGTLYLFVRPESMPNLRILAEKKFYRSQVKKCKKKTPPKDNDVIPPWSPPPRPPGVGGGDPQCLSFDGHRFECNFLGEAVWTRCGVTIFCPKLSTSSGCAMCWATVGLLFCGSHIGSHTGIWHTECQCLSPPPNQH